MNRSFFALAGMVMSAVPAVSHAAEASAIPLGSPDNCQIMSCPSYSYNGCEATLKPDMLVISGASVVEGLKPTQAKAKLEQNIKQIEQLLASLKLENAKLVRTGTGRSLKNDPNTAKIDPVTGQPSPGASMLTQYVLSEGLEIQLPVNTEVEALLEKLEEAGFNRFGTNLNTNYYNGSPQRVAIYRIANAQAQLEGFHETCRAQAWSSWCKAPQDGLLRQVCSQPYEQVRASLYSTSFYVNGGMMLDDNGNFTSFNYSLPGQSAAQRDISLPTSSGLELKANLTVQLSPLSMMKKD